MKTGAKRAVTLVCALCMFFSILLSFSSCKNAREDDGAVDIICTAFPQYDWLRAIIGEDKGFSLKLLVDNGSDLHSYQPTVADRVEISECDILVSIGGESDEWVEKMLSDNSDALLVRLFDVDGITLREISADGILSEHIHEEHSEHSHDHGHEHGSYDEHIWLSIKNAIVCVEYFGEILTEYSSEPDAVLRNADEYITSLKELWKEYEDLSNRAEEPRLIFADRFPFAYLTGDLNIEYRAAFDGCSTENSADISTVTHLAEIASEWNVGYVLVTETSDKRLAKSIISAGKLDGVEILTMDSMQAMTRARMSNGEDYLSIMRANLDVLRKALNAEAQ